MLGYMKVETFRRNVSTMLRGIADLIAFQVQSRSDETKHDIMCQQYPIKNSGMFKRTDQIMVVRRYRNEAIFNL